jgi:hypothetical protein
MVFAGERTNGQRLGVYVEWDKVWKFHIYGNFIEERDLSLLDDSTKEAVFGNFSTAGRKQEKLLTSSASH